MNDLPPTIQICECWARDGLQSWPITVPVGDKIDVLDAALQAGVREFDATAMVPARHGPQFADAEEVLTWFAAVPDVAVRVLAPNLRGVERALDIGGRLGVVDTIGFPISVSESHNIANVRMDHARHLAEIEQMVALAHEGGRDCLVAVATAYGCPIEGEVEEDAVFALARRLVDIGVDRVMLSDTTGLADPVRARAYAQRARREFPAIELIAHFHDTRGSGLVNTLAAVAGGATTIDACLGGIGGEPATVEQNHAGETGNVATEDLAVLLERSGVATGLDPTRLLAAGTVAARVLGAPGRSQVQRTGHGLGIAGSTSLPSTSKATR